MTVPRHTKNTDARPADATRGLDIPESARPFRLARIDVTGIAVIHLIALLAFGPWFFSWTGAVLALLDSMYSARSGSAYAFIVC